MNFAIRVTHRKLPNQRDYPGRIHRPPNYLLSSSFNQPQHYNDVMMGAMASQITSLTIVFSTVYSGTDQRKHQSSASLAFVRAIHRWLVNSVHKWPVARKMFPFNYVIMDWDNKLLLGPMLINCVKLHYTDGNIMHRFVGGFNVSGPRSMSPYGVTRPQRINVCYSYFLQRNSTVSTESHVSNQSFVH